MSDKKETRPASSFLSLITHPSSLVPESYHRVYLRRAPRRQVAGEERGDGEDERDAAEDQRVCGRDAVEDARHHARHGQRAREPEPEPEDREHEPLREDEPQDVFRLRAEREPDSYLVTALRDGVRHHRVEPDGREQQRAQREEG